MKYIGPKLKQQVTSGDLPGWVLKNPRHGYIIQAALSTPSWVDRSALYALSREAKLRTVLTGIPHVVGHIVPLCSDFVCGLTVPWNLRVMTKRENDQMGNRWHLALQGDLFEEPEQLRMI